ncbi:9301_t:CDS:2, partial [Acaulospora morrowiae]
MAETSIRLCCYIIRDDFGAIVEQVAKVLLQKGRLPLPLIARFAKYTLSKTRESLFILIQHNIVYWTETREGSRIGIYYSIEKDEILTRLNFGIYIKNANEWIGCRGASEIIRLMLLNGKTTFKKLVEKDLKISKKTSSKYRDVKEIFSKMIEKHYITPFNFTDSKSAQDKASEAEQRELAKVTNFIPTKKQVAEVKAKLAGDVDVDEAATGLKRKINAVTFDRPAKQRKGEEIFNEDQYFRVNYGKFNVKMRNTRFESFVGTRINNSAGLITKIILDISDDEKAEDTESRLISAQRIIKSIP